MLDSAGFSYLLRCSLLLLMLLFFGLGGAACSKPTQEQAPEEAELELPFDPPAEAENDGAPTTGAFEDEGPEEAPASRLGEASPSPSPQVPIEAEVTSWDGRSFSLAADGEGAEVEAGSSFRLVSELALVDLRIRLLDEGGKLVATRDRVQVGAGTTYELRPSGPLVEGSRYRLVVDGLHGSEVRDVEGIRYAPRIFEFRTAGEKPPPPPPVRRRR